MEPEAAKLIGAGIAAVAMAGAGVGIGNIFGSYLQGALRNPAAADSQRTNLFIGFALAEATGLFGLLISLSCCSASDHSSLFSPDRGSSTPAGLAFETRPTRVQLNPQGCPDILEAIRVVIFGCFNRKSS